MRECTLRTLEQVMAQGGVNCRVMCTAARGFECKACRKLYSVWVGARRRCLDKKHTSYANYGGEGVTMCEEWLNNYPAFRIWALSHGYDPKLSLDREDNDGNYEPGNCRFITRGQQMFNRGKQKTANGGKKQTSKYKGVWYDKARKKFAAAIWENNKRHVLGRFDTEEEARIARNAATVKYHGKFGVLN